MINKLRIVLWNANGLARHANEIKTYLRLQEIDIMLISETHFTKKSSLCIPHCSTYDTQHPDGTAHGGTAITVKNNTKHHLHGNFNSEYLQATSVAIDDWIGQLTGAAIYCSPKHVNKADQFLNFYKTLGHRFIAGDDYNAKHCKAQSLGVPTNHLQRTGVVQSHANGKPHSSLHWRTNVLAQ